jgi:hypothetical protein
MALERNHPQGKWAETMSIDFKNTHPDFTIICDKCGSKDCYIDNSLGFSETSGGWGSVDIVCNDCEHSIEIVES